MVIVTGTRRSGTSMWMQILQAAGLPIVGEAFPAAWRRSIEAANPRGFWESRLRKGVYFDTNPDPDTGAYLHPQDTRRTAVKVFARGLVRTDHAFLDRVIVTMRPWRTVVASVEDLYAQEEAFLGTTPRRPSLSEPDIWWLENYDILRDAAVRRYPIRLVACENVVQRPRETLEPLLDWLGGADLDAAVDAVDPSLQRSSGVDQDWALGELADAWYASVRDTGTVQPDLVERMNRAHAELEARIEESVSSQEPPR